MSTSCVKTINLNMGGCLPLASEITDFQIDCAAGTVTIEQTNERGVVTEFIATLCPDDAGTDTDVSAVSFDHTTGELTVTENGNSVSTTLNLCAWMSNQSDNGMRIGG